MSRDAMIRSLRGFSLTELLSVLAICGLLFGVAIPGWTQLGRYQQLISACNDLNAALRLARSEAIKRRQAVLVDNGTNDWNDGWRIYVDLNNNGQQDSPEPLLLEAPPLGDNIRILGNTPVRRYVRYVASGRARQPSGAFQAGTLTLCHSDDEQPSRQLILSISGRVRLDRTGASRC